MFGKNNDSNGARGATPEDDLVITGEELSLDDTVSQADTGELVGEVSGSAVEDVAAQYTGGTTEPSTPAPSAAHSVFEETVSLPTAVPSGEAAAAAHDQAPPVDVLQNRAYQTTAVEQTAQTSVGGAEETTVMRRSLIQSSSSQVEPAAASPFPTPPPPNTFDEVMASESAVLDGATVLPTVPSRAGARWLSVILILLFTPIAWYLLSDAGARLAFADGNPMDTNILNPAALLELGSGLIFVILIAIVAAQSGLGLLICGIIVTLIGLPFLAVPELTAQAIVDYLEQVRSFNDFGANIVAHLTFTGYTGLLVVFGVVMICGAAVISAVRRAGRRDEATRAMVAATNPDGLRAHWARRATARAQQSQ